MRNQNKRLIRRICLIVGVCLLVAGAAVLVWWQWGISSAEENVKSRVETIRSLIPEPQGAVLEERRDNSMAALSLDGTDFVGIIEIPRYESVLPVGSEWGEVSEYPCRFSGSIYDRTMQIGATSQSGQYDFYRELSAGDEVYFTDMEGNRFSYTITNMRYEEHADAAALSRDDAALTLFIKNMYGFEYLIVFCDTAE